MNFNIGFKKIEEQKMDLDFNNLLRIIQMKVEISTFEDDKYENMAEVL